MKDSKGKNIIIVILILMIAVLSGLIIYMYMNIDDVDNSIDDNNGEVGNSVEKLTEDEAIVIGKELYDKATEIYSTWVLFPYCGYTNNEIYEQESYDFGGNYGSFYKSEFKNLDDLKNYLGQYLSEDIINSKINGIVVMDYSSELKHINTYVNYLVEDEVLYCRNMTGKGWLTRYLNTYDMTINNIEEEKVVYTIKSAYVTQEAFSNTNSSCGSGTGNDINNCTDDEIEYKDTTFVIEKNDSDNWIVTDYTLHE